MAIVFKRGERQDHNPLYRKLRSVYKDMKHRCYNERNPYYPIYGGNGVYVCEEWQTLDGFFNNIDKVDGWDLEKYLEGGLVLDKDKKYEGNRVYSPDTCSFITTRENVLIASKDRLFDFYAKSPEGVETKEINVDAFARDNNLDNCSIRGCLQKRITNHKNWQFRLPHEEYFTSGNKGTLKEATDPQGNKYVFHNVTKFAEENGLGRRLIGACLNGKRQHHKGWTFKTL